VSEHDDGRLDAALQQIPLLGERIGGLDERERGHHTETREALARLAVSIRAAEGRAGDQAEVLATLDAAVAALAEQFAASGEGDGEDEKGYTPIPVVRWWDISGEERDAALARLQSWVDRIYLPNYGHISQGLRPCWPRHLFCLVTLDWLSELWAVLHMQPRRSARDLGVSAQFHTQVLPEAATQLARETSSCSHGGVPLNGYPAGGARRA
jgi:hypothetical protein